MAPQARAERDGGFTPGIQDLGRGAADDREHGVMVPADGAKRPRPFGAIPLGAAGRADIPDQVTP